MFVLGVDPGLSRCGYGAVRSTGPGRSEAVAAGVIRTPPSMPLPQRLAALSDELVSLLDDLRPDAVAVERVFFQSNVRTAISIGQASGIVLAEAAGRGLDVVEYTPTAVKSAVTGFGAADKTQVQRMVQTLLRLDAPPRPADAADALALALTHLALAPGRTRREAAITRQAGAAVR